jgi:hypothetical protein
MTLTDLIWTIVGFFLTLCVLSYIFGDNILFRFASYVLIGVSAGYLLVIILYKVLIPKIIVPFTSGDVLRQGLVLVPLALGTLLLFKLSPRLARLANVPMGYLVGTGAAVLIGGVLFGTLFPQAGAAIAGFKVTGSNGSSPGLQVLGAAVLLIGTVTSLAYFQFGVRNNKDNKPKPSKAMNLISRIGQIFIAITLGGLFAGTLLAALAALVERLSTLWNSIGIFIR